MNDDSFELQAYLLFEQKIRQLCLSKWRFMEYEDRLSEATYTFFIALRIYATNNGQFWPNYLILVEKQMKLLYKAYAKQRCRISLDAPLQTKRGYGQVMRLDFLPATCTSVESNQVLAFWDTLSCNQQELLEHLMDGCTHRSVSRKLHCSIAELNAQLQKIANQFHAFTS